jgi:hypothetical protein
MVIRLDEKVGGASAILGYRPKTLDARKGRHEMFMNDKYLVKTKQNPAAIVAYELGKPVFCCLIRLIILTQRSQDTSSA